MRIKYKCLEFKSDSSFFLSESELSFIFYFISIVLHKCLKYKFKFNLKRIKIIFYPHITILYHQTIVIFLYIKKHLSHE